MRKLHVAARCAGACLLVSALAVPLLGQAAAQAASDPPGTIYVANTSTNGTTNAIDVFPPGTNGNAAPERVIAGPDTGLSEMGDVKVDAADDVFVTNAAANSITEYAPQASGDAAPICTISGANTGLDFPDDMSLEADGTLVVANLSVPGSVVVFAPGSCGNLAPVQTIAGSNTGFTQSTLIDGVGTDADGNIYAVNSSKSSIEVFPPGANGTWRRSIRSRGRTPG